MTRFVLFLSLFAFLVSSLMAETTQGPSSIKLTEELKQQIIQIQKACAGGPGVSNEELVANIKKYVLPQYVFVVDGKPLPLEASLSALADSKRKVLLAKSYDRNYVVAGQTIVCYFKFDRTVQTPGGKKDVMVGTSCVDVYRVIDGELKTLFSYWDTNSPVNK